MGWTEAQRRRRREEYARNFAGGHGMNGQAVRIPENVVVLDRDPNPCFKCGVRDGCRHRPWMLQS